MEQDFHEPAIQVKLSLAWRDALDWVPREVWAQLVARIAHRTLRSLGIELTPDSMTSAATPEVGYLLSLIEAEHEVLVWLVDKAREKNFDPDNSPRLRRLAGAPASYRTDVNRILAGHGVGFSLSPSSQIVPVESLEMHSAVVAPTLYLLHDQTRFSATEAAYQKALVEIKNGDAADAITDAGTALQEALAALGCTGKTLSELLASAKKIDLIKGNDTPLVESVRSTVNWVAAKRNDGEAHQATPDLSLSDAWMVVHVVGALIIRLAEPSHGETS